MRCIHRTRLTILLIGLSLGFLGHRPARAQAPQKPATKEGRVWAILIGVEKYQHLNPLRFTINDVKQLEDTLRHRGGIGSAEVLVVADDEGEVMNRPLRSSLTALIPDFLNKPGPNDRLIFYFSGHGLRDSKGMLYLAPSDCDAKDLASTGISVAWLHEQLAVCKAALKLLVLDACHAGSEKGEDQPPPVSATDLARPFTDLAGVVTFASSAAEEKSQIWEDKKQSLYSYWLNQGLKGHADKDGDGAIEMDELSEYVYSYVNQTAKSRFPRTQTPVRIMHPNPGIPVLIQLRPRTLTELLNDMADQLAYTIEEQHLKKVGVLEFTSFLGPEESLRGRIGTLGIRCAVDLEARLEDLGADKFEVVKRRRLQSAMKALDFKIKDTASATALKGISARVGGSPVLVQGMILSRHGREVTIQCRLIQTESGELAGSVGGKALLSESERSELGDSYVTSPDDRRPQGLAPDVQLVVEQADERSRGPHPLSDPGFAFPVRIMIGGQERPGIARGNNWLVPVRKGEVFEIHLENKTNKLVCTKLLVDGRNSAPELSEHVSLEKARFYVLDPVFSRIFAIRGFAVQTGEERKVREFVVSDDRNALAGQQGFADQGGLITIAFYEQGASSRRREFGEGINMDRRVSIGGQIAVVNIQLVDADEPGVKAP